MSTKSQTEHVHTRSQFEFTVGAPYDLVAPLFGADAERRWGGPDWNPLFLHPGTPRDAQGMVFTVDRAAHRSVWINTAFDLAAGHVQYVYFVYDVMVTLIDIRVSRRVTPQGTDVRVVYERTALRPEANDHVRSLSDHDVGCGEEWRRAIEAHIAGEK